MHCVLRLVNDFTHEAPHLRTDISQHKSFTPTPTLTPTPTYKTMRPHRYYELRDSIPLQVQVRPPAAVQGITETEVFCRMVARQCRTSSAGANKTQFNAQVAHTCHLIRESRVEMQSVSWG